MKHVNLVVADGDRNTLGKYVSELRRMDGINVVGSTADGAELLALLSHVRADVVMTGLALKNVDGLGVLEAVHDMRGVHPKMLVLSNFCRDSLVERTMALGASYYMLKPADSRLLYKRICLLAEQTDASESVGPADVIAGVLRRIGVAPSMKGYRYLETAVAMCIEDASYVHALSGRLYPEVALRLGATPSGVERAIRTAIQTAWQNGGIQSYAAVISDSALADGRPTAGRLIACLAHACVQTMKN